MKEIPLTRGLRAKVDDADYDFLSQWKWHANMSQRKSYAVRSATTGDGKSFNIAMHRQLLCPPKDYEIDHRNGDSLDNRKQNLRVCSQANNAKSKLIRNGKQFKGVHLHKTSGRWNARIWVAGKDVSLGYHDTPQEAAASYDAAALRYFGEFAMTNKEIRNIMESEQ